MTRTIIAATLLIVSAPMPVLAQSNIDSKHAFSWGENIGWMNWQHDAPNPGDGVIVNDSYLAGYVWCENVGWLHLGDGAPAALCGGAPCYQNVDDTDYGVNLDPGSGELSGFAWGENIGWINFAGGALTTPPNPARIDGLCRLRGYAWGENVGWINLDDALHFVAFLLPGDLDGDGQVNITDLGVLLANFGASGPGIGRPQGDLNGDNAVNITDLGILLASFGQTCP